MLFVDYPHLAVAALECAQPSFCSFAVRRQLANILILWEAYDWTIFYVIRVAEFLQYLGVSRRQWFVLAERDSDVF
jgi:hypothetical protein